MMVLFHYHDLQNKSYHQTFYYIAHFLYMDFFCQNYVNPTLVIKVDPRKFFSTVVVATEESKAVCYYSSSSRYIL